FDIVRYLAADLPDETHIDERHVVLGEDPFPQEISGLVPVTEFRESTSADIPETDASTIGGLVTEVHNRIPSVGDRITIDGLVFTVMEMDSYRVARVKVERQSEQSPVPDGKSVKEVER
ncbi:MAG: hypothetical protein M3173_01655, partial [Chloroflexota bacterium]|nr:hypothetical protein [Chloroflexota bacterium]